MVGFDVSYNDPYDLILSDKFRENNNIEAGDSVSLDFSDGEDSWSIVATVKGEEDLDMNFNEEVQSLFHLLSDVSFEEMPEKLQKEMGDSESHVRTNQVKEIQEIGQGEELRRYLHDILHYLQKRAYDTDILIGSGYLCNTPAPRYEWESLLKSPYTTLGKDILKKESRPKLNSVEKVSMDVCTPSTMYFCTNRVEISDEKKEDIRQSLDNQIIDRSAYYLFEYEGFPVHGPLAKEDDGRYIFCSDTVNIEFLDVEYSLIQFGELAVDLRTQIEKLTDKLKQRLNGENIEENEPDNNISIGYDGYDISLVIQEKSIGIDIRHATDDEVETAQQEVEIIADYLSDEFDGDLRLFTPSEPLSEPVHKQTWVLDTNSLYRQRSSQGNDKITEFIAENKTLHGKNVRIPWQVLVEINRHKDAQTRTKTASERGIQNIEILKMFSEHSFFNLEVEDVPDNIDFSVFPKAGVTDIAILSSMEDDEILVTGDEYLQSLAHVQDVYGINTSSLAKRKPLEEEEAQLWSEAENILEDHPTVEQFKTELVDAEPVDRSHQTIGSISNGISYDINERKVDSLLSDWQKDRNIIQFVIGDEIHLSQSKPVEVVPTYGLLDELVDNLAEQNGEKYLPEDTLEAARAAVAGLQQHIYPHLEFLIPEGYSYQADEVDQVGMLFRLASTENTTYHSVVTETDNGPQSLNQVALRTAKENGCILLCSTGNKNLRRLGNLLNVSVEQVSME